jgi:hypothetical protein
MTPPTVNVNDLPADVLRQLNLRRQRQRRALNKDAIRGHALRVLAVVADLSQKDRRRVLEHATALNDL